MKEIAKLLAVSLAITFAIAAISSLFAMSKPEPRDYSVLFADKGIKISIKKPIYCKITKEDFLIAKLEAQKLALK